MRTFNYLNLPGPLLTPVIRNLLTAINEYRGKQVLFILSVRNNPHAIVVFTIAEQYPHFF